MVVKNFYVPADVSDFADSELLKKLKEANARFDRQDQQDLKNKLEWSSQIEAADGGKTALATAQKFLQTAGQVGSAVSTFNQNQEVKKGEKAKEDKINFAKFFPGKEDQELYQNIQNEYYSTKDQIKDDGKRWKAAVNKYKADFPKRGSDINKQNEAYKWLLDSNPARQLNIQEIGASIHASNGMAAWQALNPEEQSKYKDFESFFTDKHMLSYSDISDGAASVLIAPQATKAANTVKGINQGVFTVKKELEEDLVFKNTILKDGIVADPNGLITTYSEQYNLYKNDYISKGFKPEDAAYHSKQRLRGLLTSSIWSDQFGTVELTKLQEGIAKGVAIGKGEDKKIQGYELLSNEDWEFLKQQVNARDAARVQERIDTAESNLVTAMGGLEKGATNESTQEPWTQKDLQKLLIEAENVGLSKDNKIYKQAENFNPSANTDDVYKTERASIRPKFLKKDKSGRQDSIAEATNTTLKTELKEDDRKINQYDSDIDFNGDYSEQAGLKLKTVITGKIDAVAGLSDSQVAMRDVIENKYNEIKNDVVLNSPKGTTVEAMTLEIKTRLDNHLIGNGFKGQGGIYSATNEGEFPNLMIAQDAAIELKTGNDPATNYMQLNTALKKHGTVKGVVDSGDAITNAEFASLQLNKGNEMTGKWEGLTQDIIVKAETLGVSPITLVRAKAEALKKSSNDADKLFYETFNVEKFVKGIPKKDPYKDLNTYITEVTGNKVLIPGLATNLLYASERINPNNWTPNMMSRLIELEQTLNPKPDKSNKIKLAKKLDKQRNSQRALDAFNKQFPESDFTRKDIKWDNELKTWVLITE